MPAVVVNELDFAFDGVSAESALAGITALLDALDYLLGGPIDLYYSEELFNRPVHGLRTFYELYDQEAPIYIDRDLQERVAAVISSMSKWEERDDWPETFLAEIDGQAVEAPTLCWAHKRSHGKRADATACLGLKGLSRSDATAVTVSGVLKSIWFVVDEETIREFLRQEVCSCSRTPDDLEEYAALSFPRLVFIDGAFSGIKTMSKPVADLMPDIVKHLSILSDRGAEVFSAPWSEAGARFGSLGISVSDENGNTKSNATAKAARQREHEGKSTTFWWHSKLEPDRDRIHFDQTFFDDGRILIGIFCRHLTT